jgi:hypothetical protein
MHTSDIGIQCGARPRLSQPQNLILPLSSAAILIINNVFLRWKGDVHMLLSDDQWHFVVIGLLFSLFLDGGEGSLVTGSGAGSFCFLWGWRLLLVGRYPPSTGLLQQPLASLSFTTSTKS